MSNILSFDYELFGSGKGCVFANLINPTKSILKILSKFNIKATFFIEIFEVEAVIELKHKYAPDSYEFQAAVALEMQIDEMVYAGHDLQLHLHPQWLNASYEYGTWHLNHDLWRFSSLPDSETKDGLPSKSLAIEIGVRQLQNRVRRINPCYVCHSFRAGAYNLGDTRSSIRALIDNGIRIDSSVCHGFFAHSALSQYDYTTTDKYKSYWFSFDSILNGSDSLESSEQCLEIPMVTINSSFFERLSMARMLATIKNRRYKGVNYNINLSRKLPSRPDLIANSNFDVCLSSIRQVKRFQELIIDCNPDYVVLIGHPKDFTFFSPLRLILKKYLHKSTFVTFDQIYKRVYS